MATPVCLSLSVISFLVKKMGMVILYLLIIRYLSQVTLSHLIVNCATVLNGF